MSIREWWSGRLGSEHQKLIDQCEAKTTELLAAMTATNAVAPNVNLVRAIRGLNRFQGELARLNISMKLNGELRPNEAEALVIQMQKLNEAAALFEKANRGNA